MKSKKMWLGHTFLSNALTSFTVFHLFSIAKSEPGWLKICNSANGFNQKSEYNVSTQDCSHGVWLPETTSLDCVCVNGLWALSSDWCGEDYQLAFGNNHCFNVDTPVRKLVYIGSPDNPFESRDFVASAKAHVFHNISKSSGFHNDGSDDAKYPDRSLIIVRIRPQQSLKVKLAHASTGTLSGDSVCLNANKKSDKNEPSVFVHKVRGSVAHIGFSEECPSTNDDGDSSISSIVEIRPGKMLFVKSGKVIRASMMLSALEHQPVLSRVERSAQRRRRPKLRAVGRAMTKGKTEKTGQKNRIMLDFPSPEDLERLSGKQRSFDNCSDFSLYPKDSLLSEEEKRQLVREQTRRVMKIELNLVLNGNHGPPISNQSAAYRQWVMLQHVKKVFLKVCPPTQVAPFLVNSLMRLFRYLFIHTRDSNPYGLHFEDQAQDKRIKDSLTKCFDEGKSFEFYYAEKMNLTNCRNGTKPTAASNATTTNETTRYCQCTTALEKVNFTDMSLNKTSGDYADTTFELNNTIFGLPDEQKHKTLGNASSLGKRDLIVETMWKMITFGHFYCARQFESNPQDHSALFNKLESLFNKDIIYRWNNPGKNGRALWKTFYSAYNLDKFAESMDACVAGAKELSDYPKWLSRPTTQSRTKREVENPVMWNGNGFCLRDPWEPLDKLGLEVPLECRRGEQWKSNYEVEGNNL